MFSYIKRSMFKYFPDIDNSPSRSDCFKFLVPLNEDVKMKMCVNQDVWRYFSMLDISVYRDQSLLQNYFTYFIRLLNFDISFCHTVVSDALINPFSISHKTTKNKKKSRKIKKKFL